MPSFAIEVPGEANPLTESTLVHVLRAASSSDPTQVQTGTKQLQQWEIASGFYRHLQSAFLDQSLPLELRYLAVIQLKNGIDKYWRKTARNAASKDDKDVIRARLLPGIIDESDSRLALQKALVIAKIARYEYPQTWPDALSSFSDIVQSANAPPLALARALLAILQIVKELQTGRLSQSRQALQNAAPQIVAVVGNVYARIVDSWLASPNVESMHLSILAIKVIRRLLISCYDYPNLDPDVVSLWSLSLQHLSSFIALRKSESSQASPEIIPALEKHIIQLAKLHCEMAKVSPAAFALLPNSVDLAIAYWGFVKDYGNRISSAEAVTDALASARIGTDGDVDDRSFDEKIALRGLLLIRACVRMVFHPTQAFKYMYPEAKSGKDAAIEILRTKLLNESFVRDALETTVFKLFVFRANELQKWTEDPEEWEQREEGSGDDWEFAVRPCAEKLFLELSINFKDIIIDPLLSAVGTIASSPDQDILYKDSIYSAVGLAAPVLRERFDFDTFIRDVLVSEVQKQTPGSNILRRRVAILLGQWISVRTGADSKPLVYEIYQHMLDPESPLNDQVVRVTAGRHFADIANDWDFQSEQFLPFATTILTRLLRLIEEVELPETKLALVNTVSVVVERLDHHIVPFAESIVNLLPSLWEQSDNEHLMRQAILTILTRLINAMRAESLPLHPLVLPIIGGALQPDSEEAVYLLEDALELLASVLAQTPTNSASPELLELLPRLYPIFEMGTEELGKALEITDSYILLAPAYVLSDAILPSLIRPLTNLVGEVRPEVNGIVCNLIEGLIRSAARLGGQDAVVRIVNELLTAGLLAKILQGLHGSWTAHCTTGPKADKAPVDGIVETDYYAVLARIILGSLETFGQSLEATAKTTSLDETMKWLLEEWFSHFESIGSPSRRKLMCLALTKLLETNLPSVLLSLQSLMAMWTDVVAELREDSVDGDTAGNADSLVFTADQISNTAPEGPEAPEETRKRELVHSDEVHVVVLSEWIKHYLHVSVANTPGGEAQFQETWVANVDKDVVAGFTKLGIS